MTSEGSGERRSTNSQGVHQNRGTPGNPPRTNVERKDRILLCQQQYSQDRRGPQRADNKRSWRSPVHADGNTLYYLLTFFCCTRRNGSVRARERLHLPDDCAAVADPEIEAGRPERFTGLPGGSGSQGRRKGWREGSFIRAQQLHLSSINVPSQGQPQDEPLPPSPLLNYALRDCAGGRAVYQKLVQS